MCEHNHDKPVEQKTYECQYCQDTGELGQLGALDCAHCNVAIERAELNEFIRTLPPLATCDVSYAIYLYGRRAGIAHARAILLDMKAPS